jgi:hypothetical protein
MAVDAFDPGPNGDYPYWPRNPDGTPELGPGTRMPSGLDSQDGVVIDLTPRDPDGDPIVPPNLAA